MEVSIPWSILGGTPEPGQTFGVLVGNNDRDQGVSKQFDWNGLIETGSYARPYLWADLMLGTSIDPQVCEGEPAPPIATCEGVSACVSDDGCCPYGCVGEDLDCVAETSAETCGTDDNGNRDCQVHVDATRPTGCDASATGGALWLVIFGWVAIVSARCAVIVSFRLLP
ncbi:MAG: hypothetical protein R3C68_13435 [Myxococcota bacterium]